MHRIAAAGLAACFGLAVWNARAQGLEALTIDYDMQEGLDGWKVYDVKVAGISLVLTHRENR